MTAAKTKSIKMNFPALYSYVINNNYRSVGGVMGIMLSVAAFAIVICLWDKLASSQRIMFILVGLVFTVINPLSLAFKSYKQLKLSPSYKLPLEFTFSDKGITVAQGEVSQDVPWDKIVRVMMTKHMIAIYTGRMFAFVIPLSELGDDRAKIITAIVQFTDEYKPRLSSNLKEYKSGKGL